MFLYTYENLSKQAFTKKGKEYVDQLKEIYEKDFENKPIIKFYIYSVVSGEVLKEF